MRLHLSVILACVPAAAAAQRPDSTPVLLPSVSVTATRSTLATRALPVSVSVFDRDALRAAGITQVADVVRLVPGATVLSNGSFGSATSLFLRGGESDYVQVLVDGVPLNAPGEAFDFGQLTLDNVERVEVVRGPASVLYGSDAVSGVIQIFTRTHARGARFNALVGGGSYGTRRFEAGVAGGTPAIGWSLGAARHATDGILAFNNDFTNDVASGALRWTGRRAGLNAHARYTDYTFHYPTNSAGELSDSNAFAAERRVIGGVDGAWRAASWFDLRARVSRSEAKPKVRDLPDHAEDPDRFTSDATTTRTLGELRGVATAARTHTLTLGVERTRDRTETHLVADSEFGPFADSLSARRANTGVFLQALGNVGARTTYTGAVRRDENSAFGSFTTAHAGVAVRVAPATTVRASGGSAFKVPTFFENFATGFTIGNRALTPERTTSAELGVQHTLRDGRLTLGATGFRQRFRDLIQYVSAVAAGEPNFQNLAAASADGLELEGALRTSRYATLRASYTRLWTEVTDAGADEGPSASFVEGARLLRRPSHLATGGIRVTTPGNASLDVSATYTGSRDDRDFSEFPARAVVLDAFTRVDVAATFPLGRVARMRAPAVVVRIENVLDAEYEQTLGFRAPGRNFFVGIRIGS